MAKGQLRVDVCQVEALAWAQGQDPDLKPLALAVNVYRYPVVYMVDRRDDAAKEFAGLQSKAVCLPETGQLYLRLFLEHEAKAEGKIFPGFFSKVTSQYMVEDALDDVVDGVVQATVADQAALESYKQ